MSGTGRRLTKVEITPEMIAAGARAFALFDSDFAPVSEGVWRVLAASLSAGGYSVTETLLPS